MVTPLLNALTLPTLITILLIFSVSIAQLTEARPQRKEPVQLDENKWTKLLEGEWMFSLHAPWCPACKKLEPEWRKFAEWSDDLNINVASADVTTNPALSGRFMVRGLPTIYHVKDGVFRVYNGPREQTALINFIEEQGWKAVEPVSRWLAPNTLQMSFLAYSFRISMTLRDIHNHMVEQVGLPYYVSYLIFALCTVTIGTLLGLVIIFIIDLLCPTRFPNSAATQDVRPKSANKKKDAKPTDSDLDDQPAETKSDSSVRRRQKN
uniref:Thioredoxin-related transmembrane protein 1 n=1 Tax=Aceria tosichella TaxID=561515 RepID=A0A6G1SGU9_9ACAR